MQLILASQSPYRKIQLENFGVSFTAMRPEVDEEELKKKGPSDLKELTQYLAKHKAQSLRSRFPAATIIGSDQIAESHGIRLDKPGSRENALTQLTRMQGSTHRLITSLALISPVNTFVATDITQITMRPLSKSEIEAYLDVDQPYDCAGSYKIERAGLALVEKIVSDDPSAIQGLPLIGFTQGLKELGISLSQIWSHKP